MRFLIDGTMARGGGGFTYLVNVMPELAALAPQDSFRLLVRNRELAASLPSIPNLQVELLPPVGLAGRLRFTQLELPRLAAGWGADLIFSPAETAPLRAPCPSIAAFRNPTVFSEREAGAPWQERLRLSSLRALARLSSWSCQEIMFVSEDSARWIGEAIGLPADRRAVIHHGIDREAWRPCRAVRVHPLPYILSVSSIYRYKNYVRLIEAYAELAKATPDVPDLVILGDEQHADHAREMEAARRACGMLAENIHILGEVPYADVRSYYANASLCVFPSYLETFGHPLLEAMASEVPLVASDIPVFREIAGEAALYTDPHDARAMARAMGSALFGLGVAETLVKRGRERVRHFSWERSARSLHALFESVVERAHESAPAPHAIAA